jgi:hypothetical protein
VNIWKNWPPLLAAPSRDGGGVDRQTTLSDTRFSVHEETVGRWPAAGCGEAISPAESPNEPEASAVSEGLIK